MFVIYVSSKVKKGMKNQSQKKSFPALTSYALFSKLILSVVMKT